MKKLNSTQISMVNGGHPIIYGGAALASIFGVAYAVAADYYKEKRRKEEEKRKKAIEISKSLPQMSA